MKYLFGISGGKRVGWHVCLEFKIQDLWVGVFWRRDGCCVDVWICVLPTLPIHISWWSLSREPKEEV